MIAERDPFPWKEQGGYFLDGVLHRHGAVEGKAYTAESKDGIHLVRLNGPGAEIGTSFESRGRIMVRWTPDAARAATASVASSWG